jgi:hypothetical protein
MPDDRTPTPCGNAANRLREVAQLRKLWRAFRDPQERREDELLSRSVVASDLSGARVQEPTAVYGRRAIRAAIRHWWCRRDYTAIVTLGNQMDPALLEDEPLVRVYLDAAQEHLSSSTHR